MAWLLSRKEKREYVIRLYKEDKTIPQIAKIVHMSSRDICAITNELKAKVEGNTTDKLDTKPKSKESQAFEMFLQGKKPVEVVRDLDLEAGAVRAMYLDYLELSGFYDLTRIYKENKVDFRPFLKFFNLVKSQGMGIDDIMNGLKLANNNELPYLREQADYLRNQITSLELQKAKYTDDLLILSRRIDELKGILDLYTMSRNEKGEELARLNQELIRLDKLVKNYHHTKNSEDTEVFYVDGTWLYPQKSE